MLTKEQIALLDEFWERSSQPMSLRADTQQAWKDREEFLHQCLAVWPELRAVALSALHPSAQEPAAPDSGEGRPSKWDVVDVGSVFLAQSEQWADCWIIDKDDWDNVKRLALEALSLREREDADCICRGNWRAIIKEGLLLFGKKYRSKDGEYTFFGVVHADDDYYYGMCASNGKIRPLSCVGDIEGFGFELLSTAPPARGKE